MERGLPSSRAGPLVTSSGSWPLLTRREAAFLGGACDDWAVVSEVRYAIGIPIGVRGRDQDERGGLAGPRSPVVLGAEGNRVSSEGKIRRHQKPTAKALDQEDRLGTVSPGKLADLVILNADPTIDIRNTRQIHAVVRGGLLCDPATIVRTVPVE
jgi:hypothetical protein